MNQVQVITNSLGSGDWVSVRLKNCPSIMEGHRITPRDLVDLLNELGVAAELIELTDEQAEAGCY